MFVISLVSFIKFLFYFYNYIIANFFRFVKKNVRICEKFFRYSSNELGLRCFGCRENFVLSRKTAALNFCCAAKWSFAGTSFSSTCNLPLKFLIFSLIFIWHSMVYFWVEFYLYSIFFYYSNIMVNFTIYLFFITTPNIIK